VSLSFASGKRRVPVSRRPWHQIAQRGHICHRSNLVMRRQSLASISSQMEGDPCFEGGAGEDVVGIATLVARYLASDLFCRSVRRVIASMVIAGSSVRTKPYRRFTMAIASRPLASEL